MKRCYDKPTHFRKKISVEEQRAQKDNRFLRGRQIPFLFYEYFRPTGSCDEVQGLSRLCSIKLENDHTQDFDLRWEQALFQTSDPPSDKVFEGLYVCKLQDSSQAQTNRDYHTLRMCVKLHIEQAQRSKNFRTQSEITERAAVTEGKVQKSFTKRKTGECFHWKTNGLVQKGTLVVLYIRMPRETERHQRKERRIQECLVSNQPLITSEGEKVKSKHPLLYRREKDRLTTNARKVQSQTCDLS